MPMNEYIGAMMRYRGEDSYPLHALVGQGMVEGTVTMIQFEGEGWLFTGVPC